MSEHVLPEDLSLWPTNPWKLLGVREGDDERAVRLAYTRLIRRFKPEHFPEHFRRLRAAYEQACAQIRRHYSENWYNHAAQADFSVSDVDDAMPLTGNATPSEVMPPQRPPAALPQDWSTELDDAWRMAADGAPGDAYLRLQAVRRRFGFRREIALREYWLLKLDPTGEGKRTRLDPLAEILSHNALSGPAFAICAAEFADYPERALGEPFSSILRKETDADQLTGWLSLRWQAAGSLERWRTIIGDLERLRRRFATSEEPLWASLLLAAMQDLAWSRDAGGMRAFEKYQDEIACMDHIHLAFQSQLDQLDLLTPLADGWRTLLGDSDVSPLSEISVLNTLIADVVRLSWQRALLHFHQECAVVIRLIALDPHNGLARLDEICHIEPLLVVQLTRAVEHYRYGTGRPAGPGHGEQQLARSSAMAFLQALPWRRYEKNRAEMLKFCVQEAISPQDLVRLTADIPGCHDLPDGQHLGSRVEADVALCCVYDAWQSFWA